MQTTMEDIQNWALANGYDGKNMWPVTQDDLGAWARDFYREISQPPNGSYEATFERTIAGQQNEYFRYLLGGVLRMMSAGCPLSAAMSLHPDAFDEKFVTIVRYGEIYGELDETLQRYIERPQDRERRCGVKRD